MTSAASVGGSIHFNYIVRRMPDCSARGKGFLDNLVCDTKGLAEEFEPAREPLVLDPIVAHSGMVVFFEDKTHFGGDWGAAPVGFYGAVFCGGRRDAPNKLGSDHPGSKFRNKIVDPIEQSAHETCCRIYIHITTEYNVILFSWIVNAEIVRRAKGTIR